MGTLLINRREVVRLLTLSDCISAVEQAFRMNAEGKALPPAVLSVPSNGGGFHIKTAGLPLKRNYFAVKINANFFQNRTRFDMPNIQGLIVLCDADNGYPLAVMDSIEITILRTGAATAVAAKYLARMNSKVVTICGCGNQGKIQLKAIAEIIPIRRVFAYDVNENEAEKFSQELSTQMNLNINAVFDLSDAVRQSDICITCTPSKSPFLKKEYMVPGMFLAAVGADSHDKQELDPEILTMGKVVADHLEQAATIGELHHALDKGLMTRESVHAELSQVVYGSKQGRTSDSEITIFDSTGTALQDVAAAAIVFEKAEANGIGIKLDLLD